MEGVQSKKNIIEYIEVKTFVGKTVNGSKNPKMEYRSSTECDFQNVQQVKNLTKVYKIRIDSGTA